MSENHGNLPAGTFVVGNKWYGRCDKCGSLVRLDKFIFGSLHLCLSEEDERRLHERRQARTR